jgi:hypothetical protein
MPFAEKFLPGRPGRPKTAEPEVNYRKAARLYQQKATIS